MEKESLKYFKGWEKIYKEELREKLWQDKNITEKLPFLKKAIEKTRQAFIETGSFSFCASCARRGVKCCQAGLEWVLSPAEFLINLMLAEDSNTKIEFNLEREEDCLFLGEKGCNLILTPIFCRNFFCPELSEFLGHEKLTKIQQAMEDEANLSFKLSDYITKNYILKGGRTK